jgi:hypothetical protein
VSRRDDLPGQTPAQEQIVNKIRGIKVKSGLKAGGYCPVGLLCRAI